MKRTKKPLSGVTTLQQVLVVTAIVMILMSVGLIWHYWPLAYFVTTGRPFQFASSGPVVAQETGPEQVQPQFQTTESVSQPTISPGSTQTIALTATADRSTSAQIQIWITGPQHKQVWQDPTNNELTGGPDTGKLTQFPAGQTVSTTFNYQLPTNLPAGTYSVSYVLNSADEHTDYAVKNNILEFQVQ